MAFNDFLPLLALGSLGLVAASAGTVAATGTCDPNSWAQVAGADLSDAQLALLVSQVWGPDLQQTMMAVAIAESQGRSGVVNELGCTGLWQICPGSDLLNLGLGYGSAATNPCLNALDAETLRAAPGSGLGNWDTYLPSICLQYDNCYTKYLPRAGQALAQTSLPTLSGPPPVAAPPPYTPPQVIGPSQPASPPQGIKATPYDYAYAAQCPPLLIRNQYTGACICPDGSQYGLAYQSGYQTAPCPCPGGFRWDDAYGICTPMPQWHGVCGDGATWVNGAGAFGYGECQACGPGSVWAANIAQCSCVDVSAVYDEQNNICLCNDFLPPDPYSNLCPAPSFCPAGWVLDPYGNICVVQQFQ